MLGTEYPVADFKYPWAQSNQLSLRTQWINKECYCLGNMPDPSIIIEHLTKTWKTNRSVSLLKYIPQEINLNIIIKRRGDTVLLLLIFLIFFVFSQMEQKVKEVSTIIRKEDVDHLLFLLNIKDYGQYHRSRHTSPQVVNVHITLQSDRVVEKTPNIQSIIWCIIHQKIQDRIPK